MKAINYENRKKKVASNIKNLIKNGERDGEFSAKSKSADKTRL